MSYKPVLAPQPLGQILVPTPGTPVRITATLLSSGLITAATDSVFVNKASITTSPLTHGGSGNTGSVYIGTLTMNKTTLVGVLQVIAPGSSWSVTTNVGMNTYDLSSWYVDADVANDGIYGSADQV